MLHKYMAVPCIYGTSPKPRSSVQLRDRPVVVAYPKNKNTISLSCMDVYECAGRGLNVLCVCCCLLGGKQECCEWVIIANSVGSKCSLGERNYMFWRPLQSPSLHGDAAAHILNNESFIKKWMNQNTLKRWKDSSNTYRSYVAILRFFSELFQLKKV